ncbi:BQ5605_C009g05525 [Microbotryum silenes-dioicae]|uniref:BQ5605_C009g05525 protein n=1 Tax=Microbotryum silenes-dioicae TaxID=796604 RepID=A0A2X0P8P4_9BASI|nr:BQ5605_C009g05525 [Microbotryum silenes-dioicae]
MTAGRGERESARASREFDGPVAQHPPHAGALEPREKKKNLKRRISRGHTSLFREQNKGPRQKINATSPTALTLQPSPTNRILLSSQGTVPIRACNTSQRLVTTCVCAHSRACVARVLHSIVAPRWAVN